MLPPNGEGCPLLQIPLVGDANGEGCPLLQIDGDVTSTMGVNVDSITTDGTALHTMLLVRRIVVCDRINGFRTHCVGCFFTRRRVLHCEMYRSRKGCTTCAAARLSARYLRKHRWMTIAALVLAASSASAFFLVVFL